MKLRTGITVTIEKKNANCKSVGHVHVQELYNESSPYNKQLPENQIKNLL